MHPQTPTLRWPLGAEAYILRKHRIERMVLEALMDAEDLTMVQSRFGRLLLQGTVEGKCYRMVVDVVDRAALVFEPVTAYRYRAGDSEKGRTP